jgi:MarR family transcriptional regulator, 2-MHQ and catechol-resistance regulon repressor
MREKIAEETCRSIVRAASLLRKDLDKVSAGITGPQFGILVQLVSYGKMPLGELGKRLWVTCGNVTGLVDKLVAAGYVRRTRLRTDRRVILAEITERGRNIVSELRPVHREHFLRFTSALSEDELQELQILLEKIIASEITESYNTTESEGE